MAEETDVQKMAEILEGFRDDLREFRKGYQTLNPPNSSSNVNFNVNGGGIAFRWLTHMAVAMFLITIFGMAFTIYTTIQQNGRISEVRKDTKDDISKMQSSQDRMQDYLNVILQWSPELRQKVNQVKEKK